MKAPALILAALLAACGDSSTPEPECASVGERFDRSVGICPQLIGPPDCVNSPELCQ